VSKAPTAINRRRTRHPGRRSFSGGCRVNTELIPFDYKDVHLTEACWINGDPHFTRRAIGEYLEYEDPQKAIDKIIERNPHIEQFSIVVPLMASDGKEYQTRVFNPIGLQLIINKSNQPRALEFQIAVAHLVQAYSKGLLQPPKGPVSDARRIAGLEERLAKLEAQPLNINFTDNQALPITIERGGGCGCRPRKWLRNRDVAVLFIKLRLEHQTFAEIVESIKECYPDNPENWPSRSAAHRFWTKLRKGELKEFGLDLNCMLNNGLN